MIIQQIILIVLYALFVFLIVLLIKKYNKFGYYAGIKGEFYYNLHKLLKQEKLKDQNYDPYYTLNKYFAEFYSTHENKSNIVDWIEAKVFWKNVFNKYEKKLIEKLEDKISLSDIDYFEKLFYSNESSPFIKKEISVFLKELGLAWASKRGTIQQANRLGYFAIKGNIAVENYKIFSGNWLDAWNDFLGLEGNNRLKIEALVINPLNTNANRNMKNNIRDVKKIQIIFQKEFQWETGINLIKNLLKE